MTNGKEKITMIETFSGIGSQYLGFVDSGCFDVSVVATSDIDKEAILSYAIIHCNLIKELEIFKDYPSIEDMVLNLSKMNIGYNYDKNKPYNWERHLKNGQDIIKKYWLACHLSKQVGDISKVQTLPYCDVFTFSFPCQDISIEGKQSGIIEKETKSGLVYEIIRILQNMKNSHNLPKYLILENVKNLVSNRFIKNFNNLNSILNEMGYNNYCEIMNSKNCGVPQNRERVFGIYIRKDLDTKMFNFPISFDNGVRIKDILDTEFSQEYVIKNKQTETQNINARKLTPFEFWKLMGFNKNMAKNCLDFGVPKSKLYKQAGNTIVVDCIRLIAEHLYKSQYNKEFKCSDETLSSQQVNYSNNDIIVLGNYMKSNYNSSRILDINGITPTIKENHGTVYAIKYK